jgi:hypothetical protein
VTYILKDTKAAATERLLNLNHPFTHISEAAGSEVVAALAADEQDVAPWLIRGGRRAVVVERRLVCARTRLRGFQRG